MSNIFTHISFQALGKQTIRRLVFVCLLAFSIAFEPAFGKLRPVQSVSFETVGTYVVMKVKINNSTPLNLILDSGIRNTIITELFEGDQITLNYSDVKDLMGLGGGEHLEAYSSNYNTFGIGKLRLSPKTIFVLKENIFNLSKHTGSRINGLLGIDVFYNHVVDIDYSQKRVRFFDRASFIPPKGYEDIPLIVEGRKMYIQLTVTEGNGKKRPVKMLIDTGAELNAWFQTYKKEPLEIPSKNIRTIIGQGLNGEITGKLARVPEIQIGSHVLKNPVVSFPDSASIAGIIENSDRDGTIGSQLLSRFNYAVDYAGKHFYFKPNGNFKDMFSYNVAGIEVAQVLPFVPQAEVWKVWEDSPASIAGVREGDQILEVNGQKAFQITINELRKMFETPSRFPLRLTLLRNSEEISVKIDMKSKI